MQLTVSLSLQSSSFRYGNFMCSHSFAYGRAVASDVVLICYGSTMCGPPFIYDTNSSDVGHCRLTSRPLQTSSSLSLRSPSGLTRYGNTMCGPPVIDDANSSIVAVNCSLTSRHEDIYGNTRCGPPDIDDANSSIVVDNCSLTSRSLQTSSSLSLRSSYF